MAVPPQTNEAFLREVDEELRRDRMTDLWKRWGRLGVAALALSLIAFGGWLWWRDYQSKQAGLEGERLGVAIEQLSRNDIDQASPALAALSQSERSGYRAAARLAAGAVASQRGDAQATIAAFAAVANDSEVAQPFRDLALVRQTAAEFDTLAPDQVISRLQPLARKGGAWFGSAGELVAIAHLKAGRPRDARALFAALAADPQVPASIRSRTGQMASVLGIDVLPTALPSSR